MGVLGTLARNLDALVGPGVMLLYPLYASMRAIESPSSLDDQQWLTYWVLYSLITLFELSSWKVLQWFPLWPYMKLLLCCWLVLPVFNGAAYIYEAHVRRYFKMGTYVSPSYGERQRRVLQMMSLDARKSVERFIDTHGPDALDRIIRAAEEEAKREKPELFRVETEASLPSVG
ncbi:HVA22-like protein f [Zea mays]|uniref:HVA22-like protein n=3 Tax=Zea mays TaxID=4577 RepID=K7V8S0_MAIZE|nr:HVA22-like protein f isoform X2 [Zea mays]XP_035817775.1 HVA22-like protein f isoform X2 [Zea mays]AQK97934.1 HVA22-like protein f [Zea mays]PWZ10449.1 HVA22-like protein f [Zea mays]|eukprot:XP_008656831.1 HVA22-like protein f [Zea mays]